MAQGTTTVLGRIALRRVPVFALGAVRAEPAPAPPAARRAAAPAEALDSQSALQAVLAYLAAG